MTSDHSKKNTRDKASSAAPVGESGTAPVAMSELEIVREADGSSSENSAAPVGISEEELRSREAAMARRLELLEQREAELLEREEVLKTAEAEKKQVLLRIPRSLWMELARWADDELRSINGQIEYLLTRAVNERKKS